MSDARKTSFHAAATPGTTVTIGATAGDMFQAIVLEQMMDGAVHVLKLDESSFRPEIAPGTHYSVLGDEAVLKVDGTDY